VTKLSKSTAYKLKSTCKKAKSNTGHEIHCNTPKANYRNPPALDGVCLRMALLCCHVQSSTLHSDRRHTSKSISLGVN